MASQLCKRFEDISFEEVNTDTTDIFNKLNYIYIGLESINDIMKACKIVSGSISNEKTTTNMLNITVEHICSRLDIANTLSLESISDRNITLEGLGNIIKTIWESIKRAFNYIWEKITYLFKSKKHNNKVKEMEVKKLEKQLKDILANKETNTKTVTDLPIIEGNVVLYPFNYMDKEITSKDLIESARRLQLNFSILKQIIFELELWQLNANKTYESIKDGFSEFSEIISHLKNNNIPDIKDSLPVIEELKTNEDDKVRKLVNPFLPNNGAIVVSKSLKILTDFTNGGKVCMYKLVDDITEKVYIKTITSTSQPGDKVKLKTLDLTDTETFAKTINPMHGNSVELIEEFATKLESIKNLQSRVIRIIDDALGDYSNSENKDEISNSFNYIKDNFAYILTLANEASDGCFLFARTIDDNLRLEKYLLDYYSKG